MVPRQHRSYSWQRTTTNNNYGGRTTNIVIHLTSGKIESQSVNQLNLNVPVTTPFMNHRRRSIRLSNNIQLYNSCECASQWTIQVSNNSLRLEATLPSRVKGLIIWRKNMRFLKDGNIVPEGSNNRWIWSVELRTPFDKKTMRNSIVLTSELRQRRMLEQFGHEVYIVDGSDIVRS